MVNGEDISDVRGSEEHTNAVGVPSSSTNSLTDAIPDGHSIIPSHEAEEHDVGASSSTESLTEAIPDPTIAQAGERIVADPTNVGDSQAQAAQLNLIVGGVAAPAPAPAQPYFDIEAGLLGPPLRRSQVGPFF